MCALTCHMYIVVKSVGDRERAGWPRRNYHLMRMRINLVCRSCYVRCRPAASLVPRPFGKNFPSQAAWVYEASPPRACVCGGGGGGTIKGEIPGGMSAAEGR